MTAAADQPEAHTSAHATSAAPTASIAHVWGHLPAEQRAAVRSAVDRGLQALRIPEPLTGSQWAAKHFYLSAESSQQAQRWRAYPFQIGLLDAMADDAIEEVDFQKSARLGYTKCLLSNIGYTAHHKRRNQCVWQPTDDDSDDFCKTEVETMLRDVRAMREVFPAAQAKSKLNTLQQKKFLGSSLKLRGGKAAGNYRRLTIVTAYLDELDGFDWEVEKSGDPWTLAHKRLEGATFPKLIAGTTPRIKGLSHIESRVAAAQARMRYHVPCPHCGVEHHLQWGGPDKSYGIKWDAHDPENTVRHHCPHCLQPYTQAQFLAVYHQGAWVDDDGNYRLEHNLSNPDRPTTQWTTATGSPCLPPRHVAFLAWTIISPQVTWGAIVREFLDARTAFKTGLRGPYIGWVNETLGETWEEVGDEAKAHILQQRAEPYPTDVLPAGALVLMAGIDVQDDRFEITRWAEGRGAETWAISHEVIDANPAEEADWQRLYQAIIRPSMHSNGHPVAVAACAIDTGGHFTHSVYNAVRHWSAINKTTRFIAYKGESRPGLPIAARSSWQDINQNGRIIKRGVKLYFCGTDTAKDTLFARLSIKTPGPGYIHFNQGLTAAWFKGFTAEQRVLVKTSTGEQHRWINKHKRRNEPLDCTVMCMLCSAVLGLHNKPEHYWASLERALAPDLFAAIPIAPAPIVTLEDAAASASQPDSSDTQTTADAAIGASPTPALTSQIQVQTETATASPPAVAPTSTAKPIAEKPPPRRTAASPFKPSPFAPAGWSSRL